jgi:4-hydroxy-tetrahydrodipicolinate reductase
MKIALIGYGKMGRMIEQVALKRGHDIVLRINTGNRESFTEASAREADVAIEFTTPDSALKNVLQCLQFGLPVASGSTGWNEGLETARAQCREKGGSFLHASNFSIGVNLFFALNETLAHLMAGHPEYEVQLKEIHHTQKKDAPSGTAVTLAEQILGILPRKQRWVKGSAAAPEELGIESEREDPAPGTHHVRYTSPIDDIEIIHTAHSREGFALGAVLAAEFIWQRKGVFTMQDVLQQRP